jgi:hypothetical protein
MSPEERDVVQTLHSAIQRCHNPRSPKYRWYGARGIAVHAPWRANVREFIRYIGLRPSEFHDLRRIDKRGNYEPGNIRWRRRHSGEPL